ncbi:AMP-dependent synthetase/ligase [Saccharothrix sp. Mg75]|uniref:AMP-dependent synthetase/ligase n=1 Tax=Saccharothrix sp. Mg75 TaxID=3445357 RepID=UPI003EEF18E9
MTREVVHEPLAVPTMALLASAAGAKHGTRTAIRFKRNGEWLERTYTDMAADVRHFARGLLALGVAAGEHIAICAETRAEWTVCDLAIAEVGAVSVPVYPTNSAAEYEWILQDADVRVAICGNVQELAKVTALKPGLRHLDHVISIDPATSPEPVAMTMADVVERGRQVPAEDVERRARAVTPERIATIVYTSGSTGNPKGCLLSHGNWRAALDADQINLSPTPDDVTYLYLPLSHLIARAVQFLSFENGATLAYFGGNTSRIAEELPDVRPTILPSVPRLFEKIYGAVSGLVGTQSEKAVSAHVQGRFGNRLRMAITGGAPIAPEILNFFSGHGVPIFEGYGMTETTAVISMNREEACRIGTVGRPDAGVEVRIAEDGEVLVRGANVFVGYHRNPEATAEVVDNGWLRTGDLGSLDTEGFLTITGRKKEVIITSGGDNLTPANLENELRRCRWIAEAVLIGDQRPYPVALITLDPAEIFPWAQEKQLPADLAVLAVNQDVRDLIRDEVDRVNSAFAPTARVRRFEILAKSLSVADGELTATLKVRRPAVAERYSDVIDEIYARPS